jgi:hypothetical protein
MSRKSRYIPMDKRISYIANVLESQSAEPNIEYDPYSIGFFNGLETALSILEQREPMSKEVPSNFKYIISKMFSK